MCYRVMYIFKLSNIKKGHNVKRLGTTALEYDSYLDV